MEQIFIEDYQDKIKQAIENKEEKFMFGIPPKTIVLRGYGNEINDSYCQENNIEVYDSYNMGGTIVMFEGDIDTFNLRKDGWNDGNAFANKLLKFFKSRIENIEIVDNDFLVDGKYKVASFSSRNIGDKYIYTGFHISINPDIEIIKNICLKPMKKIPKGLSAYGITTDDILMVLEDILNPINQE